MAMNAAGRCDGLERVHAEDAHTIYPIEDLLAAEYFDDARRNAELFLPFFGGVRLPLVIVKCRD